MSYSIILLARAQERRKRRGGPLRLAGLCLPPKALGPLVPLYLQVCELLTRRIADGAWKPNTTLPNEMDLARDMGVSTGTVRKALEKLEADRLVVRRQGRGTFVVDQAAPEAASMEAEMTAVAEAGA